MRLSATDKRILNAALEAGRYRMTVDGIADRAGCSSTHICKRLKDPEFNQLFIETMRSSLLAETPEILAEFVKWGKEGSFKHGKLILEIAGVHTEKKKVDLGGSVAIESNPFTSEEEKKEFVRATFADYIEEIEEGEDSDG